jgi:hypothetical protein
MNRDLRNDIQGYDLYSKLKEIYLSIEGRYAFDNKEKFFILFDDGFEFIVNNMRQVITEEQIINEYRIQDLERYGKTWNEMWKRVKFSFHTHPYSFEDFQKRPCDGDYAIIKDNSFDKNHYIIDEEFIYCISFQINNVNGHAGKWRWSSNSNPIYISDHHFNISEYDEVNDDKKPDERDMIETPVIVPTSEFIMDPDGTIRMECSL